MVNYIWLLEDRVDACLNVVPSTLFVEGIIETIDWYYHHSIIFIKLHLLILIRLQYFLGVYYLCLVNKSSAKGDVPISGRFIFLIKKSGLTVNRKIFFILRLSKTMSLSLTLNLIKGTCFYQSYRKGKLAYGHPAIAVC